MATVNINAYWVSQYESFDPHMGALHKRYDLLDSLTAYKARLAPQNLMGRGESQTRPYEPGAGNFEGVCTTLGAPDHYIGFKRLM